MSEVIGENQPSAHGVLWEEPNTLRYTMPGLLLPSGRRVHHTPSLQHPHLRFYTHPFGSHFRGDLLSAIWASIFPLVKPPLNTFVTKQVFTLRPADWLFDYSIRIFDSEIVIADRTIC